MNTSKTIVAGVAATAVMSVVAMFVAPMMGMPKMDFGHMLGTGNPMMAMPYAAGWMIHFVVGIVMALVFAAVVRGKLPGNSVVQGMLYAFVIFLMAQLLVMPMMGNGVFSGGNMQLIMGSLIGHLVFGAVLGAVVGKS